MGEKSGKPSIHETIFSTSNANIVVEHYVLSCDIYVYMDVLVKIVTPRGN